MGKYIIANFETVPFKRKSFEGQMDRFVKIYIASVDAPDKVLAVVPLFGNDNGTGFYDLIKAVRNHELGQDEKTPFPFEDLYKPIDGEFVDVPSMHGPLFRVFTIEDFKCGLCKTDEIGRVERTLDNKVKIYNTIRVFTHYNMDGAGHKVTAGGWNPNTLYFRYYGYNYKPIADLTEPLQL